MKTNTTHKLAILILSFGLISCSKDSSAPVSGSQRLPAPVLKSADQALSLKDFQSQGSRIWSHSDTLEFSSIGGFETLEVKSRCEWNGKEFLKSELIPMKALFKIRELLPQILLTVYFEGRSAICSLNFLAQTSLGDRHSFDLHRLEVSGANEENEIQLVDERSRKTIESKLESPWTAADLQFIKTSLPDRTPYKMMLICSDVQISSRFSGADIRGIEDFNFAELEAPEFKDLLAARPLQHCRVFALNASGQIVQTSPVLSLVLGAAPMVLNDISSSQFNSPQFSLYSNKSTPLVSDIYINGLGMSAITLNVSNSSSVPQVITFPKSLNYSLFGLPKQENGVAPPIAISAPALFLKGNSEILVPANSNMSISYQMTLPPTSQERRFPYLLQPESTDFSPVYFQIDKLNGRAENGYKVLVQALEVSLSKNIFFSSETEALTLQFFKNVIKP